MDRVLEFLQIRRHPYIQAVRVKSIIAHEYYKDTGMDCLDNLDRIFNGKAEGVGIEDDRGIVLPEGHGDRKGGMLGGLYLVTFVSQYAVEIPDQDRVL